jgi:hypothetical protein
MTSKLEEGITVEDMELRECVGCEGRWREGPEDTDPRVRLFCLEVYGNGTEFFWDLRLLDGEVVIICCHVKNDRRFVRLCSTFLLQYRAPAPLSFPIFWHPTLCLHACTLPSSDHDHTEVSVDLLS